MSQISHAIEVVLFRSRFLLAPLYLGLVGALLLLTYRFLVEFIHIFEKVGEFECSNLHIRSTSSTRSNFASQPDFDGHICRI